MIAFTCRTCSTVLDRPDSEAGTKIVCPSCGQRLLVPQAATAEPAARPASDPARESSSAPVTGNDKPDKIRFNCPHCNAAIRASVRKAGASSTCPHCQGPLQVPVPGASRSFEKITLTPIELPADTGHQATAKPEEGRISTSLEAGSSAGRDFPIAVSSRRIRLNGLTAAAFQHPLDKQATSTLKALKGFDWLVGKFIEYGVERAQYVTNIGANIRVGPRQLPKLYHMLLEGCAVLDLPEPELYVTQDPEVNAATNGHTNPYIVLNTALLDILTEEEIMATLAHELGHIKCGHVLYYTMARYIGPLLAAVGQVTLGLGNLLGAGIAGALLTWRRRSEFSADRASLLVMQDARPCVSMLMKIAGGSRRYGQELDPEQFLNQARAYHEGLDQSKMDQLYRFLGRFASTHPVAVERARVLDEWIGSPEYDEILAGKYPKMVPLSVGQPCPTCSTEVEKGVKFCPKCGTPLRK